MESKHTALILVDEKIRDLFCNLYFKHLLEQQGIKVILANRDTFTRYLDLLDFDIVISPAHQFFRSLEQERKVTEKAYHYIISTEGAVFGKRNFIHKYCGTVTDDALAREYCRLVKKVFLWGQYSLDILAELEFYKKEQLMVTGSPRIHFVKYYKTRQAPSNTFPVGFVSRLGGFNPYHSYGHNRFRFLDNYRNAGGYFYDENRNLEDFMWLEHATARLTFEFLDECQRRGIRVLYRPHPREDLGNYDYFKEKYKDIIDFSYADMPFELWVEKVSCVVSFNSTTFYETLYAGIPNITLTPLIGERLYDHLKLETFHYPVRDYVYNPESMDDALRAIEQVREGKDLRVSGKEEEDMFRHIQEIYSAYGEGIAYEKIVQEVAKDMRDKEKRSKARYFWFALKAKLVEFILNMFFSIKYFIFPKKNYGPAFVLNAAKEEKKYKKVIQEYDAYFKMAAEKDLWSGNKQNMQKRTASSGGEGGHVQNERNSGCMKI